MCDFKSKLRKKIVTGYKIVRVDKHGNYYSPHTGMRYNIGKIKPPKKYGKYRVSIFGDVLSKAELFYNLKFTGFTAIFQTIDDAIEKCDYWHSRFEIKNLIVIEMKLSGNIYSGIYNDKHKTYIGDEIISMKRI